ncbi:GxxExxY protein [Telmatospirillum siberiense]|uniref:GxxExxY protein n=1 Tax=Telmatospirillum siberiense TaxID=382514 RepID=UPI0018ED1FED|nr:GxxExxY protein [Telmatospirillum siberiense]
MEPSSAHDFVSREIVDSAFAVHKALGPGLLESVYEQCLAYELGTRGFAVARQVVSPVIYRDIRIDGSFRIDMIVNDLIIVEIKATERLAAIHQAQLLTYLKLSKRRLGLLINFNVPRLKDGIRRMAL